MKNKVKKITTMNSIFFLIKHKVHLKYRERKVLTNGTIMFFDNLTPLLNKKQPTYQYTLETWISMRNENIVVPDNSLKFISLILKNK